MRATILIGTAVILGACGGPRVSGPLYDACSGSDRRAANQALCSCVQLSANGVLSGRDQRRAAGFFANPQEAQDVRQSDDPGDESFWRRYSAFLTRAERSCG